MGRQRERDHIRQLVSAYLDGELPLADAAWVGRKIAEDPRYGEVYQAYRGIRMSIRALPVPPVPPSVSAAIRAYTATTPPRRPAVTLRMRLARFTAAAATMAAVIAAIFTHGFGVPAQFGYGGPLHYGGNPTAAVVRVSSAPTVATLLNARLAYNDVAQVQFDHPVDETAIKQNVRFAPLTNLNQPLTPSQLIYSPNTLTLSTAPAALVPNTDYRVTIPKGLRDLQGNEVQNATFDFTVAPPPLVADASTAIPTDAAPTLAPIATAPAPTTTSEPATEPATATTAVSPATATTIATVAEDVPTDTPVVVRPTVRVAPTATTAPVAVATAVPAAPTATTARPVATSTPSGTTVSVAAAATTAPKPTNTVAPAATATTVPTAAPIAPTATTIVVPATATNAPTAKPGVPVAPSFQGAYAQTANRLGEPTGVSSPISGTQLKFQNGLMVYVPGRPFYVIYAGGSWGTAANPGGSGAAMANPGGGYAPGGAYGAAWTNAKLSGKLGYATSSQESSYGGSIQVFNNGVILQVGSDVYVLFNNGTYQLFGA